MIFEKIPEKYRSWGLSVIVALVFITLWDLVGSILSLDFFDNEFFANYHVITDVDGPIAYLAVLIAIQFPIFIMFLQQMVKAKHVKKMVFLKITLFKEIITGLVIGSTLVFISPRGSYVYFALVGVLLLSGIAIFKAITLIFHSEQYSLNIQKHLRDAAKRSFTQLLKKRTNNNDFFKQTRKIDYIQLYYFDSYSKKTMQKIAILAKNSGYLAKIDLQLIDGIMTKEFPELKVRLNNNPKSTTKTDDKKKSEKQVIFVLHRHPNNQIKAGDSLADIYIPTAKQNTSTRLRGRLEKAFKISPSPETPVKYFDEIVRAFELGLRDAYNKNDQEVLDEILSLFEIFVDEFDSTALTEVMKDEKYGLAQSMNELSWMNEDELGKRLFSLYELFSKVLLKSIEDSEKESAVKLLDFIYRKLHSSINNYDITSIARWEQLFNNSLGLFIYKNTWNESLNDIQEEIITDQLRRYKDHTATLIYALGDLEDTEDKSEKQRVLTDWVRLRAEKTRNLLIASYKHRHQMIFEKLLGTLQKIQRDRYDNKLDDETTLYIKCNILMIATYLDHHNDADSDYGKPLFSLLNQWSAEELLKVVLKCDKEDYASAWHIDSFDNPADGEVYSIPSYHGVIRNIWINSMLVRGAAIPTDPSRLGMDEQLQETLFFTQGQSEDNENEIIKLIEATESPHAGRLVQLTKGFLRLRFDWETNKLITEPLDQKRVEKFRELVNEAYDEASIAKLIFKKDENYLDDNSETEKGFRRIGINNVFDKEAFIDETEWHSGYLTDSMASDVGRNTATQQDADIFSRLFSNKNTQSNLTELMSNVRSKGGKWLVISNKVNSWTIKHRVPNFPSITAKGDEVFFKGANQPIPMQTIYTDKILDGLYFVRESDIGILTRKPHDYEDDEVEVLIEAYSDNQKILNDILSNPPDFLTEKGTVEAQKKFLLKKVRLVTDRVYQYTPPSDPIVYHYNIKEDF